ncbi:cell surface protein SprA [candidate division KSB1 bacterium]|nr:cell surface protein SprA [candidate division KSB1 bacterium]
MIDWKLKRSKLPPLFVTLFSIIITVVGSSVPLIAKNAFQPQLKFGQRISPLAPMFDEAESKIKFSNGQIDPGWRLMPRTFKRTVEFDSTGAYMVIQETLLDKPFNMTYTVPINDYILYGRSHRLATYWTQQAQLYVSGELKPKERGRGGLEIEVPVKIKSKAFQQIFGGDRVALTVTGNINIKGGFRHEKRSEVRTALTRGSDYNFKMEQTQQFQVQGHVGEKVTVSVDQNSERAFDFENTIKLKYTGFEDEIIQSIEAGNISLSLPATRFVSFSGKNSGLFGIKTVSNLGNLTLTTITSQEKGENKKLSINGGTTDDVKKVEDYNFVQNQFFFVDSYYRESYFPLDTEGKHRFDPRRQILEIEVYKSGYNYQSQASVVRAWAIGGALLEKWLGGAELTPVDTTTTGASNELYLGFFKRLEKNQYELDPYLGKLRLDTRVSDDEVLAVAFKFGVEPNTSTVGDLVYDKPTIILKLLKPRNPRPTDTTWELMLRNIYSIGRNVPEEGFEAKLFFKSPSGTDQETGTKRGTEGQTASYLTILGLDRKDLSGNNTPDTQIDNNVNILRLGPGEIEFPFHQPFNPEENETDIFLEDDKRCKFYDKINQTEIVRESKFYIEVKAKTRSANYQLGFNVIEGSEEVWLNGRKLVSGSEYIIDYMTGNLTLLRDDATSPSANIEINYQLNEFFQLEKKTLLGANAQYNLWEDSFIGGTFLYLNQRTLDQKVRVGQGPMRNMVWDLNTSLSFKPNFLTKVVDALPLIRTKAESRLKLEAEIAQIIPNPNTLNNEATDDNDGVAYIDDFEGANRITPLGVIRRSWTLSSCPEDSLILMGQSRAAKLGRLYWYNPWEQVYIKDIWPNRDINPNVPQRVNVLSVKFDPSQALDISNPETNWGGVMRALSSGYANQTESKFIEIWLISSRLKGRVHVELGQISEDAIPNYTPNFTTYRPELNTEDREISGIRNGMLDNDEDTGIDGIAGDDDFWDLNSDGVRQSEWEPLSNDNWNYSERSNDYQRINGTEDNANDQGGRYPDTEDINSNGSLDTRNDYYEYVLNLNPDEDAQEKKYIQGGEKTQWRLYRIPLAQFDRKVGNPSLDLVEYVRLWIDGVSEPIVVSFAEINIVGNQWLEKGIYEPVDTLKADTLNYAYNYYENRNDTVIATVINTHDNPEYDPSPTGVSGVRDRITSVIAKEQSLVLRIQQILPPGFEGIVQKTVPQAMSFIDYNKLKMFVHGGDGKSEHAFIFPDGKLEYFVRFGANEQNYYEYRSNVFLGWDKRNNIDLDLGKLASMKENIQRVRYLYVDNRVLEVREDTTWIDDKAYFIRRVINNPSLTNIRQITIGLKNISGAAIGPPPGTDAPALVEVWFNELRLSEVKKDKGIAMRGRIDLTLADLLTVNAEIQQRDADFHTLEAQFGNGQNDVQQNIGGNLRLDKLFPSEWGFSIPINYNFSESKGTPKYLAQSDILYKDLEDQIRRDAEVNFNQSQGWGVSFKKTTRSKNFFIKNSLDQIAVNYSTRTSTAHNSSVKSQIGETYTGGLSYRLDFGKRNYFFPFQWLGKGPIVNKLSQMKFYFLPSQFSTSITGTYNRDYRETRPRDNPIGKGVETRTRKFNVNRQLQAGYKPFESLDFSFNRTWNSDMQHAMSQDSSLQLMDLLNGKFGTKTGDNQTFSAKYNPNFVKWLTTNFSYSSNFRWNNNIQQPLTGRSASNNGTISGNFSFNPSQMVSSIFGIKPGTAVRRPAAPKPREEPPEKKVDETKDEPKDDKKDAKKDEKKPKEKKESGPNFMVVGLGLISEKIQPISVNYSRSENQNYNGLEDKFPGWGFRLWPRANPNVGIVEGVGERSNSLSSNESVNLQSGLKILTNMDLNVRYRYSSDEQNGATNDGGFSRNALGGMTFPEWTLRWSGLEKLPLFKKVATRVSLDHSFSGEVREKWTTSKDNITNETITTNWRPLVGLTMTLKKEISVNVSYNTTESINNSKKIAAGGNKRLSSDISVRANYSKRSGFRIPIPVWPFKNKEFKNNMDLSVTFTASKDETFITRTEGKWVPRDLNEKWEFKPTMRYSFSDRVSGGAHFAFGKTKSRQMGETSLQEFGIEVNISIRGN